MIRKTMTSLAFFTFGISSLFASCISINSFKELSEEWDLADENTLVVFDIDEVLVTTEDHFMHPYAEEALMTLIIKSFMMVDTPEEKKDLEDALSLSLLLPKRPLVEEEAPQLIHDLQKKKVKVIGLTNCPIGAFGLISKIEHWRIGHLKTLGIDFGSSFPTFERQYMEMQKAKKTLPLFEEGILFSKGYQKGEVLKSFLKQSRFQPSKVIFIDDLSENVESVASSMDSLNIDCKACQYSGAKRFFRKEVDQAILNYQFKKLVEKKEWLTDVEVERLL